MQFTLDRTLIDPKATVGELYNENNEFLCFTLEDPARTKKIYGNTCIPAGTYPLEYTFSDHFKKWMSLLDGIPGFEGVRIHGGFKVEQTFGCPLVGLEKYQDPETGIWYLRETLEASAKVNGLIKHIVQDLKMPLTLAIKGGYDAKAMGLS